MQAGWVGAATREPALVMGEERAVQREARLMEAEVVRRRNSREWANTGRGSVLATYRCLGKINCTIPRVGPRFLRRPVASANRPIVTCYY